MVYKHRTQSGKVRHYQSKNAYENSLKGMFANQYQKKNHTRKISKAKSKSRKRLTHRGIGKVSSGKALCVMCRGKDKELNKGVCKKCKELTEEFYKKKEHLRPDKELQTILNDYLSSSVRSYELQDIQDVSESKKIYSITDEENNHSTIEIPKITIKLIDGTTVEYLLLKKGDIAPTVAQIWESSFLKDVDASLHDPIHSIFKNADFGALDDRRMDNDIRQTEFDYMQKNLVDAGLSPDSTDEQIWDHVHQQDWLFDDLTVVAYLPYIDKQHLHEIRKAKYNASYGELAWDQDTLGVKFYDSPDDSSYIGIIDDE